MLGLAFLACPKAARKDIKLRTVGGGLLLLLVMAVLVLKTPVSRLFSLANGGVERLLGFTREGAQFVFGGLSIDQERFGFLFAFQVLPTILFFSALMSVLYYLGLMPWIVERCGRLLSRALRVSGPESFDGGRRVRGANRGAARGATVPVDDDAVGAPRLHGGRLCDHGGWRTRGLQRHAVEERARNRRSLARGQP